MGEDLEDFLAQELAIICSRAILTPDVRIFEEGFGRGPRKSQAQTRFATATRYIKRPGSPHHKAAGSNANTEVI
jgi:hypothetical protein